MRRMIAGLLIASLALIAACGSQTGIVSFVLDKDGNYTGFSSLPEDESARSLEKAGYVVRQGIETVANEDVWQDFTDSPAQGEDAGVRIASFYEDGVEGPYCTDLFYHGGYYYLFDSTAKGQKCEPFEFMLTLKGQFGNPQRESGVIVLTNDDTLTFEAVMGAMLSSSLEYIQSVPAHRLVMFL